MRLTTVYTDYVFNQKYHILFNGLLQQKSVKGILFSPPSVLHDVIICVLKSNENSNRVS